MYDVMVFRFGDEPMGLILEVGDGKVKGLSL